MTEIDKLKAEIEDNKAFLSSQKFIMEQKLKGDMGKQMLFELSNPPTPNRKIGLFIKWKRNWIIFKENLKKII